jgi:outer membrane biosynthesis protein TonB
MATIWLDMTTMADTLAASVRALAASVRAVPRLGDPSSGEGIALAANNCRIGLSHLRGASACPDGVGKGRATHASSSGLHLARSGVVLAVVFLTAVFASVAHAGDLVAPEETVAATSSTDTTADTSSSSDPVVNPTEPQAPSTDPTAPSDVGGSTSETPTDAATPTEPPADSTGIDESSPPPEASAPPPESTLPAEVPSDAGSETPPVIEPMDPSAEQPLPTSDGDARHAPTESVSPDAFPGETSYTTAVTTGAELTSPFGLELLRIHGGATTKDQDQRFSNGNRSNAMRSFLPERSPASSSSSGASGGSGGGGSAGGVGLAVEFLLAALVILRYAPRASFTLPHSCAFALREERPG